jgi:predicted MFS family arabinose efflux permease
MPVFADDVLHVGPQGLGMLLAATGAGAVLGVLTVLNFTWVKHKGRVVLIALFCYGLALIGFGLSPIFALSLFFVALLGALDQVNVTFRNTVLLLITPDQLRGRIESIRMLFIVGAPALGAMQAGAIASLIGAPFTITAEAFFVLAGVLFVGRKVREVREIEL